MTSRSTPPGWPARERGSGSSSTESVHSGYKRPCSRCAKSRPTRERHAEHNVGSPRRGASSERANCFRIPRGVTAGVNDHGSLGTICYMNHVSRGFHGRRPESAAVQGRVPPGQYVTEDFPVLSAGPTPDTPLGQWTLSIDGASTPRTWTWEEFRALPSETVTVDVHCVTRWSKLGTRWEGVSLDTRLGQGDYTGTFVMAHRDGGYTTNLPVQELLGGQAWVAFNYDGKPLAPEHGGPARLLVPHLYFWKSAKWVRRLLLLDRDVPGFWETYGYHNHGDPWREQPYSGD